MFILGTGAQHCGHPRQHSSLRTSQHCKRELAQRPRRQGLPSRWQPWSAAALTPTPASARASLLVSKPLQKSAEHLSTGPVHLCLLCVKNSWLCSTACRHRWRKLLQPACRLRGRQWMAKGVHGPSAACRVALAGTCRQGCSSVWPRRRSKQMSPAPQHGMTAGQPVMSHQLSRACRVAPGQRGQLVQALLPQLLHLVRVHLRLPQPVLLVRHLRLHGQQALRAPCLTEGPRPAESLLRTQAAGSLQGLRASPAVTDMRAGKVGSATCRPSQC